MYKYYEYGTVEYYDQELTKAMNNLRMVAKGFRRWLKMIHQPVKLTNMQTLCMTLH